MGLGDAGLGLRALLTVVLDAVAPGPGFFGSVFPGEAMGRGERPDGVADDDTGGFLLGWEDLGGALSIPLGVFRSRPGFAIISSSNLSSAAKASSIALGRVGLRRVGSSGIGVALRRGGCGVWRWGGGLRRAGGGGGGGRGWRIGGGGDSRCRFTGRDTSGVDTLGAVFGGGGGAPAEMSACLSRRAKKVTLAQVYQD